MGKILNTDNPKGLNSLRVKNKRHEAQIVLDEDELKVYVDGKEKYNLADISGGKQDTLVSGENIKSVNGTSILSSGDLLLQVPLVSGTNIKTVNGNSLLGSGNLE